MENSRSTHSLLNGPPAWRNSVYNHSSASHRSNFFLAMTPSIKRRTKSNEPLVTDSQRGAMMVLSWRYLSACCTRVGPSPDHYIVTLTTVYSRLKGCNRDYARIRWRHIGASLLDCRKQYPSIDNKREVTQYEIAKNTHSFRINHLHTSLLSSRGK